MSEMTRRILLGVAGRDQPCREQVTVSCLKRSLTYRSTHHLVPMHCRCAAAVRDLDAMEEAEPRACLDPNLGEREAHILLELGKGDDAQVGFSGLRRRLGLHQQQLTRALRRMERDGYVARGPHGYGLTEKGFQLLSRCGPSPERAHTTPVASAILPEPVRPEAIVDSLAHRWFGGLRWYGLSEGPGETVLAWQTETENVPVRLRIAAGSVSVEVGDDAVADKRSLAGAAQIVSALFETYARESSRARSGEPDTPFAS